MIIDYFISHEYQETILNNYVPSNIRVFKDKDIFIIISVSGRINNSPIIGREKLPELSEIKSFINTFFDANGNVNSLNLFCHDCEYIKPIQQN